MADLSIRWKGLAEFDAALGRMVRDIDTATLAALKATQALAKKSVKSGMRGAPRWDHRGASQRTGPTVTLNRKAHHVPRSGGPGRLTGTLQRGVGGVRRPVKTPAGYSGGVGVGGGLRNLYKKRTEGKYPYLEPGIKRAEPAMGRVWTEAWGRAVK